MGQEIISAKQKRECKTFLAALASSIRVPNRVNNMARAYQEDLTQGKNIPASRYKEIIEFLDEAERNKYIWRQR